MTELEVLRAENRGLRERSEAFDVGFGGMLEAASGSVEILKALAERYEHDEPARQALTESLMRWQALLDEVIARMRAFSPLPNPPKAN
jgi:hypothetical protein